MVSKKSRRHRRSKKGGYPAANPASYNSATSYGMAVNGTGDNQYNRVFSTTGPDSQYPSNQSVGVQGQNLGYSPSVSSQKAGNRRRKRGGFWGQIVNQALVPFGVLGMQQTYKKKSYGGSKSRKHRKHRKH
jgi:hypothetical protein